MTLTNLFTILKGNKYSGNFGHAGIPGKVGGSKPGGGHVRIGVDSRDQIPSKVDKYRELKKTIQKTFPKKEVILQDEKKLDVSQDIAKLKFVLKDSINIRDEDTLVVQNHIKDLALVPDSVLKKFAKKGVKVDIGDTNMTELDDNAEFANQTPRGWPSGYTWKNVAGNYNPKSKSVSAGSGLQGSESLILHEYGHAIQYNKGLGQARYDRLREINKKNFKNLPSYLQQGGPGGNVGTEEMWAEGFATTLKDRNKAIKAYGQDFVDIVDEVIR